MAAYASLVSLMQIIDQIKHHPSPPISMDKKQVETLKRIIVFLQEFLEGYKSPFADGDEADPLEMRIADAVYAAEDLIESHICNQIRPATNNFEVLKERKNCGSHLTSADLYDGLVKVMKELNLIKKEVMEIIDQQQQRQVSASATAGSSTSSLPRLNSTTMVGFDDVMLQLMEKLIYGELGRQVIPIVGMGGIGKTTLARNVYANPFICHHFDICVSVAISQQFNTQHLLGEILSQADKQGLSSKDEIGVAVHKYLSYRRYLILLDDMWSIEAWNKMQVYFPDNCNGSRIMVTTRLSSLGSQLDSYNAIEMKFMDEESSWRMFCKIVFGEKSCPSKLEKLGKKIVESCKGLPLSIVVIGGLLEKLEPKKESWESIRRSLNSLVNSENDNHCLKILKLSYKHLPVYLKPCFLYMGTYEEDCKILVSRVIKLWLSEGFIKPIRGKSLEIAAKEYLGGLVDRNLILVHEFGKTGNMKYLKIHDLIRDLCLREAEKERFYHVVGKHSPQDTCSQRRVIIPRSISKEKVLHASGTSSHQHVRSFINNHDRVQLLPNFGSLRILSAGIPIYPSYVYSLRKLFELVNLRHLVISNGYSSQLSSSMNLIWSLQTLIVYGHNEGVNAPVEIWNMPQLRHVCFSHGLHLPNPQNDSIVILVNLQTLRRVINFKFDEMMVRKIPNIKKLGLRYTEVAGTESRRDDYCVHNIGRLQKLESLSFECYPRGDLLQKLTFPYSLKSLTLKMRSGRMEDIMEKVSTLPLIQKLKLLGGNFTTGKWVTVEGQFPSLKYLSLASCRQLKCWMMESSHFPCLEHMRLRYLNDLEEIPVELGEIPTLKYVALEYCSESAVKSAKIMVEEQEASQEELSFKVVVTLSKMKMKMKMKMEMDARVEELLSLANHNFQVTVS